MDELLAQENVTKNLAATDRVLWPIVDHLGTVRDLVKQDGTVATHFMYDAYGGVVAGDTSLTRYLFTSREYDVDTSLQYNRARWYDASTGRRISEDPLGFAAGDVNTVRYVGNGVVGAVDPSGLFRLEIRFAPITSWYYHAFIVVIDEDGSEYYFRGGPGRDVPGAGLSDAATPIGSDGESEFGSIATEYGPYVPGTVDWHPDNEVTIVGIVDNDEPADEIISELQEIMDAIADADIPYEPVTANSNSVVYEAIEAAGLSAPPPPVRAPGYGGDLDFPGSHDDPSPWKSRGSYTTYTCFLRGTRVHTVRGVIAIEDVLPGDTVASYDIESGEWTVAKVLSLDIHSYKGRLVELSGNGWKLVATASHPFWVPGAGPDNPRPRPRTLKDGEPHTTELGCWVEAKDLTVGDKLLTKSGTLVSVTQVKSRQSETQVYNVCVERLRNYCVTDVGILVHNS